MGQDPAPPGLDALLRATERRYRKLFEQIPDGIFVANHLGQYLDVNPAGCELLGMTRDEVLQATFLDLLCPEEHARLPDAIARLDAGEVIRDDWRFRRQDGSVFIGELTGCRNTDGLLQGVLRDVTEARRIDDIRREGEERFRVMTDDLPLIVWVHDARGRLEYVNRTYCDYFGITHEEARGERWKLLVHPEDDGSYAQEFLRCSAERRPFRGQCRVRRADGEWRWIESWARPRWVGTDFAGMVGTSADITRRMAATQALAEADRRKDEFLALLAHELRNPLAPLRNGIELLRLAQNDDETAERTYRMMARQVATMTRLVDDLLDVSRVARGKLELRCEACDLGDVLRSAVETSAPLIDAGRHTLHLALPRSAVTVNADRVRLEQVFANLLNNAARYTRPGGRIELGAAVEGAEAVVTVSDNGVGIPEPMLDRVFDAFTQVPSRDRPSHGGLGLGLSLARSLVDLHGGSIRAASRGEGQGTRFTVRLPLAPAPHAAERAGAPEKAAAAAQRVLLVDDNRDAADSLAALLQATGHEMQVAYDGAQALHLFAQARPDVVLLDIGMPGMDGCAVARRMREQDPARRTVLVALTGYGQAADRQRSMDAGFDHHLVKPVELQSLKSLLRGGATPQSSVWR
jgi:PAS domain S-box-containing protein